MPVVLRYGMVGLATQAIYLSALAMALVLQWHYLLGMAIGQVCAIAFAFPMYRAQVFRSAGPVLPQLVKFLAVWWTGVAISFTVVPVLVEGFQARPFLAQVVVLVGVVGISFLSHRGITFRARHDVAVAPSAPQGAKS